jgi:hypothetical protein
MLLAVPDRIKEMLLAAPHMITRNASGCTRYDYKKRFWLYPIGLQEMLLAVPDRITRNASGCTRYDYKKCFWLYPI